MKKGHRTRDGAEEDIEPVPRFSMDYGYMNRRDEEDPEEVDKPGDSPILVMVDEKHGYPLAYPLAKKGVTDNDWLIQLMSAEIEALGYGWGRCNFEVRPGILHCSGEGGIASVSPGGDKDGRVRCGGECRERSRREIRKNG